MDNPGGAGAKPDRDGAKLDFGGRPLAGGPALGLLRKLRAGITWLNTYHPTFNEAPWGGYKQSGINLAPAKLGWFRGAA